MEWVMCENGEAKWMPIVGELPETLALNWTAYSMWSLKTVNIVNIPNLANGTILITFRSVTSAMLAIWESLNLLQCRTPCNMPTCRCRA